MKNQPLKTTIKNLKLDYADSNITEKNFPPEKIRGKVELVDFKRGISSGEAIKELEKKGLVPANLYELLGFVKNGWNEEDFIVTLGSVWRDPDGHRRVPCLVRLDSGCSLRLSWFKGDWSRHCRFAAVRLDKKEIKYPKKYHKQKNWDFEPTSKDCVKFLETYEKFLLKHYGERCPTKAAGCVVCRVWTEYDLIKLELLN